MKLLRITTLFFSIVALVLLNAGYGYAINSADALSSAQQAQVNQMIHDYLLAHPDILIPMSQKLQADMHKKQTQQAIGFIKVNAKDLFTNSSSPVGGNTAGKVTLVEFFDYQCVYCAKMYLLVKEILQVNPDVKIIFKEFPFFGEPSEYAATVALAANKQGKYIEMHNALFDSGYIEGKMSNDKVDDIVKKVGLKMAQLRRDMKSVDVRKELTSVKALAQKLGIQATPVFIIVPTDMKNVSDSKISFISGAVRLSELQHAIDKAK